MNRPSGVQIGVPASASSNVRRRAGPPAVGTTQRSPIGLPSVWKNAMDRPSGDTAGSVRLLQHSARIGSVGVRRPDSSVAVERERLDARELWRSLLPNHHQTEWVQ
jgi:hypothetical protein